MTTDDPNTSPVAYGRPSPAAPLPQIVIQQPSMFGRFGKLLLVALGVAILIIMGLVGKYQSYFSLQDGPQEKFHSLNSTASKKVAIISVSGTILEGDGFVKKQINRVSEDEDVVAVVLRIDSPGGTVTGADYLYHHLRELTQKREIPLVVSMGSVCASGGYYIAMAVGDQEDAIFAEPTTWTGSIGVIIPHYDLSKLIGEWNIKDDSIASGPLKQMGSLTRPMTDQERKLLQGMVDQSFDRFKEIVLRGRPKLKDNPQELATVTTGQIFTAEQALEHGLVDKLGFIEEAIDRAAELSGHSTDDLRCVQYKEPKGVVDELMGASSPMQQRGVDLAGMLDLATPRAYYLWTWLPAILTNSRP
jgi:protease IV